MKKKVNIYEAKSLFSKLIQEVEKGTTVIICRNGKPVANLVLHKENPITLRPNPKLQGTRFEGDPTQGVAESDWPKSMR